MPILLRTCPNFESWRKDHFKDQTRGEDGIFIETGDFAAFLVECYGKGQTSDFERVFGVIETLLRDGDEDARGLAIVGVLESIQTVASHQPFGPDVFRAWLGPLSTQAWDQIDKLWKAAGGSLLEIVRLEQAGEIRARRDKKGERS